MRSVTEAGLVDLGARVRHHLSQESAKCGTSLFSFAKGQRYFSPDFGHYLADPYVFQVMARAQPRKHRYSVALAYQGDRDLKTLATCDDSWSEADCLARVGEHLRIRG